MKIHCTSSYIKHGCNIQGRLGLIEYSDFARHGYNTANQQGGLFDCLDRAKEIAKKRHPDMVVVLAIPDLVFRYSQPAFNEESNKC